MAQRDRARLDGKLPPDQPEKDRSVGECGIAAGPRHKTNSVGRATAARPTSRLLYSKAATLTSTTRFLNRRYFLTRMFSRV